MPFSVHVPENFQKKLAHNESLRQLKANAIEKLVKVCFLNVHHPTFLD